MNYIYVYIYVCVCIYIYIYIYILVMVVVVVLEDAIHSQVVTSNTKLINYYFRKRVIYAKENPSTFCFQ